MLVHWLLLGLAELGNFCLAIYVLNRLHGLGFHEGPKRLLMLGLAAAWAAGACALLASPRTPGLMHAVQAYALFCDLIAGLGLPLSTLAICLRRRPDGIRAEGTELVDLGAGPNAAQWVGPGAHNWMLRLPGCASLKLRQVEWSLAIPGLPPALDGLSLLHLTDLHFAPCYRRRFFDEVIERAAAWDSDLVLLTGDLIDHEDCLAWIEPVLSRARGRLGTFAILGNHDFVFDVARIRQELQRAGFADLEGRWQAIEVPEASATLALGGTAVPWGAGLDLAAAPEADLRILLSHTPDLFLRACAAGIDLVLAGHNHGGQVRFPLIGPIFVPSVYGRWFDRGFFRDGRTLMHVGEGIGAKHPVRYGTVPEITRLVLRAAVAPQAEGGSVLAYEAERT